MQTNKPPTSVVAAASLLARQLKDMQTSKDIPGISVGLVSDSNVFEWEVMLMINDDCKYYGGLSLVLSLSKKKKKGKEKREKDLADYPFVTCANIM